MEKALGLVEVTGLSSAIETADVMAKAANVTLIGLEAARGSGMMTIKVNGDVGAVRAAVEAGKAAAMADGSLVSVDIIARPNEGTAIVFVHQNGIKTAPNFYCAQEDTSSEPLAADQSVTDGGDTVRIGDTQKHAVTEHAIQEEESVSVPPSDVIKEEEPPVVSQANVTKADGTMPLPKKKTVRRARRTRSTRKAKTNTTPVSNTENPSDE